MFLVNLIATLADAAGDVQSKGCFFAFVDEPKCPKSLIK